VTHPTNDRRKHPRVDVLGHVDVQLLSRPMPATVRGLSASGFSIEAAQPLEVGGSHRFQFRFQDAPIQLDATCVHCTRFVRSGHDVFLIGFDFDPIERRARTALMAFIDELAAATVD
jgi:hypothetical protein